MLEELRRLGSAKLPGIWLDTGDAVQGSILLLESETGFEDFSRSLETAGSIFVRHLSPIELEIDLEGEESDVGKIAALLPDLLSKLIPTLTFSVQSRVLGTGKLPFRKVVLNETLSLAIENATGAAMDCRSPQQVVSILCTPSHAYLGVSPTDLNRSAWPGGKHRFKREDDQISRAEFKLLEAMSVFELELPSKGRALDIGASPGGWTRMLADRGLQVDAVDPADLDERLRRNRGVTHLRKRIQDYSPGSKEFSIVVNDMKMDARDSIEIMLGFANRLTSSGIAVMTLKMPKMSSSAEDSKIILDMLRGNLARLSTGYDVVGARQLYHNRSEVTVAMRSRQR